MEGILNKLKSKLGFGETKGSKYNNSNPKSSTRIFKKEISKSIIFKEK